MILIKTDKEIEFMRQAGKIVGNTLLKLEEVIRPGITTAELDIIAEEYITKQGAKPSLKVIMVFQLQYVHLLIMK